jgi:hypothetical protein
VVRAYDWVDFRVIDGSSIFLTQHRVFFRLHQPGCRAFSIVGDVLGNDRDIGDGTMADLLD